MKYSISTILILFLSLQAFCQAGIFEKESDFKNGKLKEIGSFESVKNGKLFFTKDGEEIKIKRNSYYGFRDNDGYDYRINDNRVHKLHVKGNICIWGYGINSELTKDNDDDEYYSIKSISIYVSDSPTATLALLTFRDPKSIGKLIRSDNKLYNVFKRIGKKAFRDNDGLLFYVIYLFNERKPIKDGYIK